MFSFIDKDENDENNNIENIFVEPLRENSNCFSKLFFIWSSKVINKGKRLFEKEKRYYEGIFRIN